MIAAPQELSQAVEHLRAGDLIGLPTETVYGLAGDATKDATVRQIFKLKGRPANHPVIVHLHDAQQIKEWARDIPQAAWDLAAAFWPGPLTMILPRHDKVLDVVTGGHPTVGLRIPAHPVALQLLRVFGQKNSGAVAAPSANRFGRVSPTQAAHVRAEFGQNLAMVLEGGACEVGIESTIVDLSRGVPSVLRPGQIGASRLGELLGPLQGPAPSSTPAPGTLASHYAVKIPTYAQVSASQLPRNPGRFGWIGLDMPCNLGEDWQVEILGQDPAVFARGLYHALRRLEAAQVQAIYIQTLPDSPSWQGVADRVGRASVAWA